MWQFQWLAEIYVDASAAKTEAFVQLFGTSEDVPFQIADLVRFF